MYSFRWWRVSPSLTSDGTGFYEKFCLTSNRLHLEFLLESSHHSLSFDFFNLTFSVLIDKFIDEHIATANSDLDLVSTVNLDVHLLLSELVHAFRMPNKHYLHLFLLWIIINVFFKNCVNAIIFFCYIDSIFFCKKIV